MYLTPDNAMQIQLWNANLIDTFYSEAGDLLARLVLKKKPDFDLRLLEESLIFNRKLFLRLFSSQRFPVEIAQRQIHETLLPLHYNLQEFYQERQQSLPIVLRETAETQIRI
jgi:hypothetical protein